MTSLSKSTLTDVLVHIAGMYQTGAIDSLEKNRLTTFALQGIKDQFRGLYREVSIVYERSGNQSAKNLLNILLRRYMDG